MKTLPRDASEMGLHVLADNPTRVMNIMGIRPLMAAMRANPKKGSSTPPDQNCWASTPPAKRFNTTKTPRQLTHSKMIVNTLEAIGNIGISVKEVY